MSIIPCISKCKFQKNGICVLESTNYYVTSLNCGCVYYVPKDECKYKKASSKKDGNLLKVAGLINMHTKS